MGRYRGPKHKLSRREGKDLFGTGGESLQRRLDRPPGQHGPNRRPRRESEYSKQLREKQKVKRMYGMREKQFQRFYLQADKKRGQTGINLLTLLERRLDNVVYRLGFARSRPQARQFVSHGLVYVNGQRVNIPSYLVSPGETITMKETLLKIPDVQELAEGKPIVPGWLERREDGGTVIREPERIEIDPDIEEQRIVEFYSR